MSKNNEITNWKNLNKFWNYTRRYLISSLFWAKKISKILEDLYFYIRPIFHKIIHNFVKKFIESNIKFLHSYFFSQKFQVNFTKTS